MKSFVLIILLAIPGKVLAGSKCLSPSPISKLDGIAKSIKDQLSSDGWSLAGEKVVKNDFDKNGQQDFAVLIRKNNRFQIRVIWDGKNTKHQCHSKIYDSNDSGGVKDPCKFQFKSFTQDKRAGILLAPDKYWTGKYLCKNMGKTNSLVWHNVGDSD